MRSNKERATIIRKLNKNMFCEIIVEEGFIPMKDICSSVLGECEIKIKY